MRMISEQMEIMPQAGMHVMTIDSVKEKLSTRLQIRGAVNITYSVINLGGDWYSIEAQGWLNDND